MALFRTFIGTSRLLILLPLFMCLLHETVLAHTDPCAPVPSLRALKVDASLQVDGVLDEPFWQKADVASNFIDMRTGKPAAQQTKARIAYTRKYLYVAVECFDNHMDKIHATEKREDRFFRGDDWVEVQFDPLHTHNSKYAFFSNPLGTRLDASEGPSGKFNTGWSAEWELKAKMYKDRWVFEMKIPLGIMNYLQEDGQTWGLNFTRKMVNGDVTSFWSFNETDSYKPRYFGHLVNLDLADSQFDRNLEFTPYVSSRTDFNGKTHTDMEYGTDLSFRLKPSIITSWTFNPDFGQVESDADDISLRDTERFLPEKRLFFREGDEILLMPQRLYYSRRFTDIDVGAKASGDLNRRYKFSLLDIHGGHKHGQDLYGNSTVLRVIENLGTKSHQGYYLSDSEFKRGHSRVASTDGLWFLTDDIKFQHQLSLAADETRDKEGMTTKDRHDYLGLGSLSYSKYPWYVSAGYRAVSEQFNPVLGFIPRRNIYGPTFYSGYYLRSDDQWYKDLSFKFDTKLYENDDGETVLRDYSWEASTTLQNDMALEFSYDHDYHAPYHNPRFRSGIVFFDSDYWKETGFSWGTGTFEKTDYNEIVISKHLKPLEAWPIRYEFTIRFEDKPDGTQDTIWLNRLVFDYYFTDDMWLKTSLQQRASQVHNYSIIYGWEFVHDAHWYLVYNNVDEGSGDDSVQSIFVKLAYTFR